MPGGQDDGVRSDVEFRPRDVHRHTPPVAARLALPGADESRANHCSASTQEFRWRIVRLEVPAFFEQRFQFSRQNYHILAWPPINDADLGTQPQRRPGTVHRGITAADHDHTPADIAPAEFIDLQQEGQAVFDAFQTFPRQVEYIRPQRPCCHHHRIKFCDEL